MSQEAETFDTDTSEDAAKKAVAAKNRKDKAAAKAAVVKAQAEEGGPVRIRMRLGQYIGLGCPDPDQRMREEDLGHGYDHDHPARSFYKEVPRGWDQDTQKEIPARQEYVKGEVVQLFPLPEHETDAAAGIRAASKRYTFSRKEAVKTADRMVKLGTAEYVQ